MTYRGQRAVTKFAPSVGLDTFKHGRDVYFEDPNKEVQLLRWIDRNPERKIVWIDDEIYGYLRYFGNSKESNLALVDQLMQHPNLLMVQPKAEMGVTKTELREIDDFLAGNMTMEQVLAQNERIVHPKKRR